MECRGKRHCDFVSREENRKRRKSRLAEKLEKILAIWQNGKGVVCLQVSQ